MTSFAHITVEPEDEDEIVIQAGVMASEVAAEAAPEPEVVAPVEPADELKLAAEQELDAEPEVPAEQELVAESELVMEPEIVPEPQPVPQAKPRAKSVRAQELEEEREALDAAPMSKMQKCVLLGAAVLVAVFAIYCIVCL